MLHTGMIMVAQIIKPQAVLFPVDQFLQKMPDLPVLGGVQQAFKDRVLHPLGRN